MKIIRRFFAIGQGAFYCESVGNFNVVYDCGTLSTIASEKLDRTGVIRRAFAEISDFLINAVFISHYDTDHINGLSELLTHFKPEYIFLPYIADAISYLVFAQRAERTFDSCDDTLEFLCPPADLPDVIHRYSPNTKVVFVKEDDVSERVANNKSVKIKQLNNGEYVLSGTKIMISDNIEWVYIPYNIRYEEIIKKIKEQYEKDGISIPRSNNIGMNEINEAKRIYRSLFKTGEERNANSMVVYSGPLSYEGNYDKDRNYNIAIYHMQGNHTYCNNNIPAGCLYLGDYNLQGDGLDLLSRAYAEVNDHISVFQVPHHGSMHNFNNNIFTVFHNIQFCIINSGLYNRYNHPHKVVLDFLISKASIITKSIKEIPDDTVIIEHDCEWMNDVSLHVQRTTDTRS